MFEKPLETQNINLKTQDPVQAPQMTMPPMPAPVVPAQPDVFAPEAPVPRRSKKWILIAVLMVLLLIAGGGAAYAYTQYSQSPERVMPLMVTAMKNVDSISFVLDAELWGVQN